MATRIVPGFPHSIAMQRHSAAGITKLAQSFNKTYNCRLMFRFISPMRAYLRTLIALCTMLLLAACSGGGGGAESPPPDNAPPPPVNQTSAGFAIVKVATAGAGWVALADRPLPVANITIPDRRLHIAPGGTPVATFTPANGWALIDFALHPSQQTTLALANDRQVRLVRLSAQGQLLAEFDLIDLESPQDPFLSDPIYIRDATAMVPFSSRDTIRLAPLGEELAVALRTGKNAVVAYRYRFAGGGFNRVWRRLVEPGVYIGNGGITSGTYDPFGSLDNQWRLVLAAHAEGRLAVAVNVNHTELPTGHGQHFNESATEFDYGFIVTSLAADGTRQGSTIVNLGRRSDVHAISWNGEEVAVAGRIYAESRPDGAGWNGYLAVARPSQRQLVNVAQIDVDRGDALLGLQAIANGRYLATGSTGYVQNPSGASVSEAAEPLLVTLNADGSLRQRINVNAGPRHNQLRGVAAWRGGWLLAGLTNGPGTHSADGNPALLTADGYIRESTFALP